MKKKLAFILAAVMIFSAIPVLNILAAVSNVTVIGFDGLPGKTMIPAAGYEGASFEHVNTWGSSFEYIASTDNEVKYVSPPMFYSIEKNNGFANQFMFVLTLTPDASGAKFLYGYPTSSNSSDVNFPVYSESTVTVTQTKVNEKVIPVLGANNKRIRVYNVDGVLTDVPESDPVPAGTVVTLVLPVYPGTTDNIYTDADDNLLDRNGNRLTRSDGFLYEFKVAQVEDVIKDLDLVDSLGKAGFKLTDKSSYGDNGYNYLEYWEPAIRDDGTRGDYLAFIIEPIDRSLYVTLTGGIYNLRDLEIPMAVYIGEESDVSVYVSQYTSSVIEIASKKINNLGPASGSRIYINEIKSGRDSVALSDIIITESTRGALRNNGWIKLTLTKGFEFKADANVTARTEYKLDEFGYYGPFYNSNHTEMYIGFHSFAKTGFYSKILISGIEVKPDSDMSSTDYYGTMVKLTAEDADYYYNGSDDRLTAVGDEAVRKLNVYKTTFDAAQFVNKYDKGDVNGDGKITTADAVMVLQHISKIIVLDNVELEAADTDKDGKITTADAVLLLQYIAKIIPKLP